MNNLDDILKLLNAMAGLPFESMEVSTGEVTIRVNRGNPQASVILPAPGRVEYAPAPAEAEEPGRQGKKPVAVTSPIIGVFYSSPSPEDGPFVKIGDTVRSGQTLCIVEAMKLMNEIPSPVTGTLLKVLAMDGSDVEVGQALFLVEAAEGGA
jgi:acetyl-CoA carboxylase biotin carboxyl carrier protein